jgi:hypothetical protein
LALAGPLAEGLQTQCWQDLPMNPGDDEYLAFEEAELLGMARGATHTWINRLRFQTLELLRIPSVWAAVEAVAQALVKRKTLNSAAVHKLVRAALPYEAIVKRRKNRYGLQAAQ